MSILKSVLSMLVLCMPCALANMSQHGPLFMCIMHTLVCRMPLGHMLSLP